MKKVLLLDDSRIDRLTIKTALEANGIQALTVSDPESLIPFAIDVEPDVILLDIMMRGQSGFDIIKRIKETPAISSIPVIFISSHHDPEALENAFFLGCVDYINKPFDAAQLVSSVNKFSLLHELADNWSKVKNHMRKITVDKSQ